MTAASTGTPSEREEPRPNPDRTAHFADFVILMTELLNRQEALEPQNTTKINKPVYTTHLTTSWEGFIVRRKKPVIANVAVARELAGWAWSLAVME